MNDKALVEISVPAAGEKFDVYIPLASKMSDVLALASAVLSELCEGKYKATSDAVLCNADSGIIYNVNMEAAEVGIKNGTRLMLI